MPVNQTPKELNDLGDRYFHAKGSERNIEMAFTYYKKAADLNNPVGYYNVAKYFIEKDQYKEASEYLQRSKDLGYTKAMIKLSDMYLNGHGFHKSKKKAFKMLQAAVDANDVLALHQLGLFHLKGIGCKKSEENALGFFERSAEANIAIGMFHLGQLHLEARKIKRDFEAGFFWLDKAAENGELKAIHRLIELYTDSHPYLKKKSLLYLKEMAFYYKELLARKDDAEALVEVAFAYDEGNAYTKVNYEKANLYFDQLLKLDHTKGYLGKGLAYLYGRGVAVDYKKAFDLLTIASTRGDVRAMNAMGEIYRLGYGVDVNYQRAKDYYFEAAKANETNALINLGLLNYRKQIQGAKPELAFQYMTTASEKGNQLAHYWLGIFHEKGIGTGEDYKKAEIEYKHAIDAGNEGAKYKYAQMLFENIIQSKQSAKKKNPVYEEIRSLLIEYIHSPNTSDVNTTYSLYMLGKLYSEKDYLAKSPKISRYYYESAAERQFTKAMVRMYEILKDKEPQVAFSYLSEAVKRPSDGEELYLMADLYYTGGPFVEKDTHKAKELYAGAAALGYQPAKEKMIMF